MMNRRTALRDIGLLATGSGIVGAAAVSIVDGYRGVPIGEHDADDPPRVGVRGEAQVECAEGVTTIVCFSEITRVNLPMGREIDWSADINGNVFSDEARQQVQDAVCSAHFSSCPS